MYVKVFYYECFDERRNKIINLEVSEEGFCWRGGRGKYKVD